MSRALILKKMEIIGHRGARGRYPENGTSGILYAAQIGVTAIEIDICLTKDRHLVVHHDFFPTPKMHDHPETGVWKQKNWIHEMSLSETKKFISGQRRMRGFPQQLLSATEISTLDEILNQLEQIQPHAQLQRIHIEPKIYPQAGALARRQFADLLIRSLDRIPHGLKPVIQCFDFDFLRLLKSIDSAITIAPNVKGFFMSPTRVAESLNTQWVCPHWALLRRSELEHLKRAEIHVLPWTVNSPRLWSKFAQTGVNGIITDYPEECLKHLRSQFPPDRLNNRMA